MSKNVLSRLLGSSVVFFSLFLIASSASAATYWVRPTGTMSGCTPSASAPGADSGYKSTINAGIGCLASGDTLYIRAGTYPGINNYVDAIPSGTSWSNPVTIAAYPGEQVILTKPTVDIGAVIAIAQPNLQYVSFENLIFDSTNQYSAISINQSADVTQTPHHIRFKNFEAKNSLHSCVQVNQYSHHNWFTGGEVHDCSLQPGTITGFDIWYGFYVTDSDSIYENIEIYNVAVSDPVLGYAMHFYYSNPPYANRNIIRGIYAHNTAGLLVWGGDSNQIYNNIIANSTYCLSNGGGATNTLVYNNTCYNPASAGFYLSDGAIFRNNIHWGGSSSSVIPIGSGIIQDHNICVSDCTGAGAQNGINPMFVNAAGTDFHLQSGSPAINQGATLGSPYNTDFDGNSRPVGTAYDIGAFEYGGSVTPPPPPPPPPTCTNLWNSALSVPSGFGASFNWFTTAKELLMNVLCSGGAATLSVGNGTQTEYIYKTGYTWTNNQWTSFNYSGQTMDSTGNWFIGTASNAFAGIDITQKQSVLAYICEWTGVWKCGCNDNACTTNYWNLQQFKQ